MSNSSRRQRGRESEKCVADYLVRNGFKTAHVTSMAASGSDVLGIPGIDFEVKARSGLPISETMAQLKRRRKETGLGVGVLRLNGQGEKAVGDWVAILTFDDLIYLLQAAGYGDPR
jgi:hypothetical protein